MKNFEEKKDVYVVIKKEDMIKAFDISEQALFWRLLNLYDTHRASLGKKQNYYLVVNKDEPYAEAVLDLIRQGEMAK